MTEPLVIRDIPALRDALIDMLFDLPIEAGHAHIYPSDIAASVIDVLVQASAPVVTENRETNGPGPSAWRPEHRYVTEWELDAP